MPVRNYSLISKISLDAHFSTSLTSLVFFFSYVFLKYNCYSKFCFFSPSLFIFCNNSGWIRILQIFQVLCIRQLNQNLNPNVICFPVFMNQITIYWIFLVVEVGNSGSNWKSCKILNKIRIIIYSPK